MDFSFSPCKSTPEVLLYATSLCINADFVSITNGRRRLGSRRMQVTPPRREPRRSVAN